MGLIEVAVSLFLVAMLILWEALELHWSPLSVCIQYGGS